MTMTWEDLHAWQDAVSAIWRKSKSPKTREFFNAWYWEITPVG